MPRFMIFDPSRVAVGGSPETFHESWEDVQDEVPDALECDPPEFEHPIQVEDGNVLLTITLLG